MNLQELKGKIKVAIEAITSEPASKLTGEYLNEILRLFCDEPSPNEFVISCVESVICNTLSSAPGIYDGTKKVPPIPFWKNLKRVKLNSYNALNSVYKGEKLVAPVGEEREKTLKNAALASLHFANIHPKNSVVKKRDFAAERLKRYEAYAKNGMVRIDDPKSVKYGKWIPIVDAETENLKYHCPKMWLNKQKSNRESFSLSENGIDERY